MYTSTELPEINKTYYYFDDGKISSSRKYSVKITKIIPFMEIDLATYFEWLEEVKEIDWVYAPNTDYFIKGDLYLDDSIQKIIFVRTFEGKWFSLGWWGGYLDVDGKLNETLKNI